jgi:hypothetical protein
VCFNLIDSVRYVSYLGDVGGSSSVSSAVNRIKYKYLNSKPCFIREPGLCFYLTFACSVPFSYCDPHKTL